MSSANWKDMLKEAIEATYEKVLRDIPASFEGLSKQQKKKFKYQLKIIRRRAAFDISLGVAVVVGNAFAISSVPMAIGVGIGTSAAGGMVLIRRGGHAFIGSSPHRP